jgi:Leu/Phe-tRNA-protein transferase
MANINIFEKIMTNNLSKLTNNIYWNHNYKKTFLFIKPNIYSEDIELIISIFIRKLENWYYQNDNFNDNYFDFIIISSSLDKQFIEILMKYGFVILAGKYMVDTYNHKILNFDSLYQNKKNIPIQEVIIAKFYNKYKIVFLDNFHIPKSTYNKLNKYELRIDTDFDLIVDKCAKIHGEQWLFENTRNLYKKLYRKSSLYFGFTSFAVYHNNELKAGEFGCVIENMYISYSGFYEESGAGTIQLIKMFQYLRESGFECCNLFGGGDYKYRLGAVDINLKNYLELIKEQLNRGADTIDKYIH